MWGWRPVAWYAVFEIETVLPVAARSVKAGRNAFAAACTAIAFCVHSAAGAVERAAPAPPVVYEMELSSKASPREVEMAVRRMVAAAGGLRRPANAGEAAAPVGTAIALDAGSVTPALAQALVNAVGGGAIVWDRDRAALQAGGYLDARGNGLLKNARVRWLDGPGAYDPGAPLFAPRPGRLIHGDREFIASGEIDAVSTTSHLSFLASSKVDRIVVVATPRAARGVGLHGAVAQGLIGNLDNWRRFYADGGGAGLLALWQESGLAQKTVFALLDARVVQIAGGPRRNALYERDAGLLLGSTDPVALDARALEVVQPLAENERLPSPAAEASDWLPLSEDGQAPFFRLERLR